MASKALLDLLHNLSKEPLMLILARVEDLVDEPRLQQLLGRNALAHNQRLIRLADAQAPHKRMAGRALRHQPERRKGREQERVRRAVYEVRMRDQRRGKADDGPIERGDEDFRVRVERVGDLEVVGDEIAQVLAADVGGRGEGPADGDIGARGEVAACACEDRDGCVGAFGDLAHEAGEAVVEILG